MHEPAVAKDADLVGQVDDLLEPVRDVDDGESLVAQLADDLEEPLGLASRTASDVGSSMTRIDALRRRALRISTIWQSPVARSSTLAEGRMSKLYRRGELVGPGGHSPVTDHEGQRPSGLGAEVDVLGDGQVLGEVQLLVDHRDARLEGLGGIGEDLRPAVNLDGAGVRLIDAREDLHQRGLARAVLADQGVHRARADGQTARRSAPGPGRNASRCPSSAGRCVLIAGLVVAVKNRRRTLSLISAS